ncbi:hypothetical protein PG996_004417 [Apiospora saccharicola]|uniref:Prion-inhibition and propagation HeLo domain-containing protein n=1 Tax=Apiospora saccharicola TaxID=335842 RepID=A0ABR1W599_9PEZI
MNRGRSAGLSLGQRANTTDYDTAPTKESSVRSGDNGFLLTAARKAFGIVSGTVGLLQTVSYSLDCFKYIQLGRHFERDYQQSLVLLKPLECRFSRWATAVEVFEDGSQTGSNVHATLSPSQAAARPGCRVSDPAPALRVEGQVEEVLAIDRLLLGRRHSRPRVLGPDGRYQQQYLQAKEGVGAEGAGYASPLFWTSSNVCTLPAKLEKHWPDRRLSRCATQLELLQKATEGIDTLLQAKIIDAIAQKGGHRFEKASGKDESQTTNGNIHLSSPVASQPVSSPGYHTDGPVEASGRAQMHNGDWYGGSPFSRR